MSKLQSDIDLIGTELVTCNDRCDGIWLDPKQGILPRSLYLDRVEATGRGCLAVGLNPGTSKPNERSFFRHHGATYERQKQWGKESLEEDRFVYVRRVRRIIDELGLSGPILWSNLAKCENEDGLKDLPPVQTMRHCAGRFLRRELEAAPTNWAVFAIGRDAFLALAYLVPDRAVIGFPHPTGGYRDFRKMFKNDSEREPLRKEVKDRAIDALLSAKAVWLGRAKQSTLEKVSENSVTDSEA